MTPIQIIGERTRKSRFDPDLARRVNEEVEREERQRKLEEAKRRAAGLPPETPPVPDIPPAVGASSNFTDDYILMPPANTYALGLHGLQEACTAENNQNQPQIVLPDGRKVYRANTFLENILARMNGWETLRDPNGNERTVDERKRYFNTWLDSSCGIAYQKKSTKLKLQLVCPPLMGIAKDFNEAFLPVDYTSFNDDVTLDSSSNNFARDGWLALLEGKEDVYQNYLGVLKAITGRDIVPYFWERQNTEKSELRAVYVDDIDSDSNAIDDSSLSYGGRFLRRRSP
ncbi:hypothetical protein HY772_08295 [Candidatus Woesearchaeota archaeon]|nr:hypothetical protein [Candidatus Woesearchaeota archaeon]